MRIKLHNPCIEIFPSGQGSPPATDRQSSFYGSLDSKC